MQGIKQAFGNLNDIELLFKLAFKVSALSINIYFSSLKERSLFCCLISATNPETSGVDAEVPTKDIFSPLEL